MARRWDAASRRQLLDGVGSYGIKWFQRKANAPGEYEGAERSRQAIYNAARRYHGPGGLTRGVYTLRRLILETGYSRTQLFRARTALKQKWKRLGPRGAYLITEEQADEVLEWLKHDYWSKEKRLYCCLGCQTDSRSHCSLGLCSRCYFGYRRRCKFYGLPCDLARLNQLLSRILMSVDKQGVHARVLEEVVVRLEKGFALSEEHLEWLHMLEPSTK